jgi:hypothetical protein
MEQFANDTIWLAALQKGEPAAESLLFERHFRSMCLLAEKITGDLAAAEDIVAEVFVRMFDRRTEFETIEGIKAFLYVSVRNRSYTFTTAEKRHRRAHMLLASLQTVRTQKARAIQLLRNQLIKTGKLDALFTLGLLLGSIWNR